jgi:hypothetical protein
MTPASARHSGSGKFQFDVPGDFHFRPLIFHKFQFALSAGTNVGMVTG